MRPLSTAIYSRLAADATLTALLGTTVGVPSIFAKLPVPTGAVYPLVKTVTVVADVDQDMLTTQVREISRDIAVYGKIATDFDKVIDAAERIRALFHRQPLTVAGWRVFEVRASGAIDAPAEAAEIGRIVTLSIRLQPA